MKKIALLIAVAIMVPSAITFAEQRVSNTPASPVNLKAVQNLQRNQRYNERKHDSGLRSWEFVPYTRENDPDAEYTLYFENPGSVTKPALPGIEYSKLCYHWKNCVRRVYRASNRYSNAQKDPEVKKTIPLDKGTDLAFTRDRSVRLKTDSRSGNYKLWNWRFVNERNR